MNDGRPFLLLRARVAEASQDRFLRWFRDVHMGDARRIPGMVRVRPGRTASGTSLALYTFESAGHVQAALGSPEAAYARGTWDQWAVDLEEMSVELWAPLSPLPIFRAYN